MRSLLAIYMFTCLCVSTCYICVYTYVCVHLLHMCLHACMCPSVTYVFACLCVYPPFTYVFTCLCACPPVTYMFMYPCVSTCFVTHAFTHLCVQFYVSSCRDCVTTALVTSWCRSLTVALQHKRLFSENCLPMSDGNLTGEGNPAPTEKGMKGQR